MKKILSLSLVALFAISCAHTKSDCGCGEHGGPGASTDKKCACGGEKDCKCGG
jgi:hypothetical protein